MQHSTMNVLRPFASLRNSFCKSSSLILTFLCALGFAVSSQGQQITRENKGAEGKTRSVNLHKESGQKQGSPEISPEIEKMLHYFNEKIYFTENKGQWESPVLYRASFPLGKAVAMKEGMLMSTYLAEDVVARSQQAMRYEIALSEGKTFDEQGITLRTHSWLMKFIGSSDQMSIEAKQRHDDEMNYFIGDVSATDVSSFQEVWYNNVYKNVDVRYYPAADGSLEYDIVCKPGFNSTQIMVELEGANKIELNNSGSLVVYTSVGEMSLPAPVAYQKINGEVVYVDAAYKVSAHNMLSFELGKYDPSQPLIIDPIALRWATWVNSNSQAGGDTDGNHGHCIWVNPVDGAIYVVARVNGTTNNITIGAFETSPNGDLDMVVGKYNEPATVGGTGTRLWQTYLGGEDDDNPYAMEMGPDGNIYITGYTDSNNFPLIGGAAFGVSGGIDKRTQDAHNVFVLKMNPAGNSIKSAVLGGDGTDDSYDLRISSGGDVYVCGSTSSDNLSTVFPSSGANTSSGTDVLIFKIDQALSTLSWMKNYGGAGTDQANIMQLNNATNEIFVAGSTASSAFPVTNARQTSLGGDQSGFLQKINAGTGSRIWSSYFKSANSKSTSILCMEFSQDKSKLYFGGITTGLSTQAPLIGTITNQPASGSYDNSPNGDNDFFVTCMDTTQVLISSTYLGGASNERNMMGLNVDLNNDVYIFGYSNSRFFPVTADALQANLNNTASNSTAYDKVFVKMPASLATGPLYSTFYGGTQDDYDPVGQRGIKFSQCRIYTIVTAQSKNIPLTVGADDTNKESSTSIYEPGLVVWNNPPDLANNQIFGSQTICAGVTPAGFTGSVPNYVLADITRNGTTSSQTITPITTYTWQMSPDSTDGSWVTIVSGSNPNLPGATIGPLTQKTYFRRIISGDACIIPGAANQSVKVTVLSVPGIVNNISCNGAHDGSVTATPDGTPPYVITWDNGSHDATRPNLGPGSYTVTVSDASGCSASSTFMITEPAVLAATASSQNSTCGAANGSATANPTGGTAPYTYVWSPGGQTTQVATGLSAGGYSVIVTDAHGCIADANVVVGNVSNLTISTSKVDVLCHGQATGSITVTGNNGTVPYQFSFNGGGYAPGTGIFGGLAAGTYLVSVKDNTGCIASVFVTINEPAEVLTSSFSSQQNVSCSGQTTGSATVQVAGGSGSYTYVWTPDVSTSATATGLTSGQYSVVVSDGNGCSAAPVVFNIEATDYDAPEWTTTEGSLDVTVDCNDGDALTNAQTFSPTATDDSGNSPVITKIWGDYVANENGCGGTITNIFIARDECLHESLFFVQVIAIQDVVPPTFVGGQETSYTYECGTEAGLNQPSAYDLCGVIASITHRDTLEWSDGTCSTGFYRIWTATDQCGNHTDFVQTISFTDTTPPVISGQQEITVSCDDFSAFYIETTYPVTITDSCSTYESSSGYVPLDTDGCTKHYDVVYGAVDACGNFAASWTRHITVVDNDAPTGLEPADITIQCGEQIPAFDPQFDDNCDNVLEINHEIPFVIAYCNDEYTEIWTATDDCGNSITVDRIVHVQDTIGPVFQNAPGDVTVNCNQIPGVSTAIFATDNCDPFVVVDYTSETGEGCPYTITRTWVATDDCGNETTHVQVITVEDNQAPSFPGSTAIISFVQVSCYLDIPSVPELSATDNCDNDVDVDFTEVESNPGSSCGNTITRAWTATDNCVNQTTFTQTIVVNDTVNPVLHNVPDNFAGQCGDIPLPSVVTATDNCDTDVEIEYTETPAEGNCPISILRTWIATDDCGNTATATQTVTINDTVDPILLNVPDNTTVECDAVPAPADVTASDNCAFDLNVIYSYDSTFTGCGYTLVRHWYVQDYCENDASASQTIVVNDTTDPTPTYVPANATYQCADDVVLEDATFTDNCDNNLTVLPFSGIVLIDGGCGYMISRGWTATDACGNDTTVYQGITVQDTIAPVLHNIPANVEAECGQIPAIPTSVFATDNCDSGVVPVFSQDENIEGCYAYIVRTWTATDECGNTTSASQTIVLGDNTDPYIVSAPAAEIWVECNEDYSSPIVVFDDNCDSELTIEPISAIIPVECGFDISYVVKATDDCGNSVSFSQGIHIRDTVAPTINCPGTVNVACADDVPAAEVDDVETFDACHIVTVEHVGDDVYDYVCENQYKIARTYSATDECGNTSYCTQTINVFDNQAPVFTYVPETSASCGESVEFGQAEAVDNCGGLVEITYEDDIQNGSDTCGQFLTLSKGGFQNAGNPVGQYNTANFSLAFPSGITIGCATADYKFTTAASVPAFLPAGGMPAVLASGTHLVNPTGISNNLAAQLLAAELNVGYDAYDTNWATPTGNLGDLIFASGTFAGQTVNAVIQIANDVLGGCSNAYSAPTMSSVMEQINLSFHEGNTNTGDLVCADDNENNACSYTAIRTWTATDVCGNHTSVEQIVIVSDDEDPTATYTPSDIEVECGDEIPYLVPTFTDNCDLDLTIIADSSITMLDCGYIIHRSFVAFDDCENGESASYDVTVTDATDPVLHNIPANIEAECGQVPPVPTSVFATDNCDNSVVPVFSEDSNIDGCYNYIVRSWTATDDCGNTVTETQTIIVGDHTDPYIISSPASEIWVECGDDYSAPVVVFGDNCDNDLTIEPISAIIPVECGFLIAYTIRATDDCGNFVEFNQGIHIQDTQAPVLSGVPDDVTAECGQLPEVAVVVALDACDGELEVSYVEEGEQDGCYYNLVRTWSATDACGNTVSQSQTIVVGDNTPPYIISAPDAEVWVECDEAFPAFEVVFGDNCDDSLIYEAISGLGFPECGYDVSRSITATDDCGNSLSFGQVVHVRDTTAPEITFSPDDITIDCESEIPAVIEPTFSDNCDTTLVVLPASSIVDLDCGYQIHRTWTATDDCGNETTAVQNITVTDTVAPVIDPYEYYQHIECYQVEEFLGITATDNCSEVTITYTDDLFSGGCLGTLVRTYYVSDECGNTTTAQQFVSILDTSGPVILNPADATVQCNEAPAGIPDIEIYDACGNDVDIIEASQETVIIDSCTYQIIWHWIAKDFCENLSEATTVINVTDTQAPVFAEVSLEQTFECNEVFDAPAAPSVTDNCDEDVAVVYSEETVARSCPQSYDIYYTWRAADNCGNEALVTIVYHIRDTEAPIFSEDNDPIFSYECDETLDLVQPSATDNCGDITYDHTDVDFWIDGCSSGFLRIWTATDECENTGYFTQYISIYDTTAPVVDPFDAELEMPCDQVNDAVLITATDNCNGVFISYEDEYVSGACQGKIIRTYTVRDACYNYADGIYQQIITLIDNVYPVVETEPTDVIVECGDSVPAYWPVWSDNCDDSLALSAISAIAIDGCSILETTTWFAEDNCGNVSSVSRLVTTVDTTDPFFVSTPADWNLECDQVVSEGLAFADDACDDEVSVTYSDSLIAGNCPSSYTIVRTFIATDDCMNTAEYVQHIYVSDNTAPVFTYVPEGGYYSCEEGAPFEQATAEDNCSESLVTYTDEVGSITVTIPVGDIEVELCGVQTIRTWIATDACGNAATETTIYFVYDNVAPVFDQELEDVTVECSYEIPAPVEVTATDNCGTATVSVDVDTVESDECGNQILHVIYTAVDECNNASYTGYYITVYDETDPELSGCPSDLVLACNDVIPAAADVTATDNCDNDVTVVFSEMLYGDVPAEGSISDCNLITPVRPVPNTCGYPYDWALTLFGLPASHRYYSVEDGSFVQYPDGSVHLTAELHNVQNNANGWNLDVWFGNQMDWSDWSTQAFPTGFKADCGGEAANHTDWMYFIMQAGAGAEMTGFGGYTGSSLNTVHAPANDYFGFQLGDGANNYNGAENGFGGWFSYNGVFFVNGNAYGASAGNISGAGDIALELDCCPDYYMIRTWTAEDCTGNSSTCTQTISFDDSIVDGPLAPLAPSKGDGVEEDAVVSASPNPASNTTLFTFTTAVKGKTTLELFDLSGKKVADVFMGVLEAGIEYKVSYDVNSLATGVYMYRLTNGNANDIGRLIVNK